MTPGIDEHHDYESVGKAVDTRLLRRLYPYARPQLPALASGLLLLFAITGLEVLGPWLLRLAVDGTVAAAESAGGDILDVGAAERGRLVEQVLLLAGAYALCLAATLAVRYGQFVVLQRAGQEILHRLRAATFEHLQRLPISFFDKNQSGRLVSRVTSDVETLNELFTSGLITLAGDVIKIAVLLVVIFAIDPHLAWITVAAIPVIGFTSGWFRVRARQAYRATRSAIARVNAYLGEAISGIRVLQGFAREDRAARVFAERNAWYRDTNLRTVFYFALFFPVVDWITYTVQGGVFWRGGIEIGSANLTIGEFIQFWYYLAFIFEPLREMAEKYNVLQSAMASTERIFGLLDTAPESPDRDGAREAERLNGEVGFEDVSFSYIDGEPVLDRIDLAVGAGQTLALVGATGGGKTTLTALLMRLYEPDHGVIRVDGVDVRDYRRASLRGRVAYVPQDVFLFRGTILDNLRMAAEGIREETAIAAARAIGADRWIERLKDGYGHVLDERGANLSAGERQMLAFARALAADPDILILDEATSSVDSETEARIQQAIEVLLEGRTGIVVAHRLSTIRKADQVAVLHHGQIRERGTHRELLRQDGIYRRLYRLQFGAQGA